MLQRTNSPIAYIDVRLEAVRISAAVAFTEFGRRSVSIGHVVLAEPNVLSEAETAGLSAGLVNLTRKHDVSGFARESRNVFR